MKKGILLVILLIILSSVFFVALKTIKGKIRQDFTKGLPAINEPKATPGPSVSQDLVTKSLFVPYWSVQSFSADPRFVTLYYFGISATENGIDKEDPGYTNLTKFTAGFGDTKKELVVRMVNKDTPLAILKSKEAQEKVISQSLEIAKDNNFSGVVLDLELAALPFDSLVDQVTSLATDFATESKASGLDFSMTLYGDTFYRVRPFEVKTLSKVVPSFLIMAYDFHKSGGNPGPNFPLSGKDAYGYDYETMLDNFLQYVPPNKLTVIYGMYGYDWEIDDQGKATGIGKARTLVDIENNLLGDCSAVSCSYHRDTQSSEMVVEYKDEKGAKHVVWTEDEQSVQAKEAFARKMGISHFSYWAYSYF